MNAAHHTPLVTRDACGFQDSNRARGCHIPAQPIFVGMKTCNHKGCDCPVPTERANRGDAFCSDYCAKGTPSQSKLKDDCGCGHPSCHHHGS